MFPLTAAENGRLLRLATYASVATASLLILAKLAAWLLTGSVSVLASLVDSAMDAGASLVNLLAVRWSLLPPDEDHRFGHGKAQALAALAQATFIAGSALFLGLQARRPPDPPAAGRRDRRRAGRHRLRDPGHDRAAGDPAPCHPPHRLARDPGRCAPLRDRPGDQQRHPGGAPARRRRLARLRPGVRPWHRCSTSSIAPRASGWRPSKR